MEVQFFDSEGDPNTPVEVVEQVAGSEESSEKSVVKKQESQITEENIISEEVIVADLDDKGGAGDKDSGKSPSSEASSSSSSPPYSVLAKALHQEGVLTHFDEEEFTKLAEKKGSPGLALIGMLGESVQAGITAYKESLNPLQNEYLTALENGIPHDKITQLQSSVDRLDSITEESLDKDSALAASINEQLLKLRGFSDSEIKDQLADDESIGKTIAKGKASLKVLQAHSKKVKADELKQADDNIQADKDRVKDENVALKARLDGMNEISPEQKLSPQLRKKIFEAITVPVAIDRETNISYSLVGKKRAENPVDFDIKLAYQIVTGAFDGDLKNIKASARTSAINELDESVTSIASGAGGIKPAAKKPGEQLTSNEYLESLKRTFSP